jgi:hypothetical protein
MACSWANFIFTSIFYFVVTLAVSMMRCTAAARGSSSYNQ